MRLRGPPSGLLHARRGSRPHARRRSDGARVPPQQPRANAHRRVVRAPRRDRRGYPLLPRGRPAPVRALKRCPAEAKVYFVCVFLGCAANEAAVVGVLFCAIADVDVADFLGLL